MRETGTLAELSDRLQLVELEASRLRRLLDQLPALVAFWDTDLQNVIANAAYVDWFGMTPDQIRGLHIREVLGEEVYAKNLPFIRDALAGKEQLFSRTLVDPTGRTRHSQASYVPELIDGEVVGFSVLVTDVTPRVEAQRELDDAQSMARVGSWVYYPRTGEMTWSAELFRILGWDRDVDQASLELYLAAVHPDDLPAILELQAAAGDLKEPYELHYRLRRPDGVVRQVHSRGRPEVDDSGSVSRITGTLQDETELRRAAEQLAETNERLSRANELLSDTIAMLSHDIRHPIQSVTGYLELMDDGWGRAAPEVLHRYLERAKVAAGRMDTLVDDVLMLVNIDSGVLATRTAPVRLSDLVTDAVERQASGTDVVLDCTDDAMVLVDPFHLRQVVANLLVNAIRYGTPPIEVSTERGPTWASVTVTDHGEGVPSDYVPQLFDRFTRATTGVAAGKPGSGFGLYIARQLIRANHGDVSYRPVEPCGSSFTVTLPLAPAQEEGSAAHAGSR